MFFRKAADDPAASERAALLRELQETQERLRQTDRIFNLAEAPELTDYAIHERRALMARHSYLLRMIRELDAAESAAAL